MTWDEAVEVMRSGRLVVRGRGKPLRLQAASTDTGKRVRVIVTAGEWPAGQPAGISSKHRAATDWEIATVRVT